MVWEGIGRTNVTGEWKLRFELLNIRLYRLRHGGLKKHRYRSDSGGLGQQQDSEQDLQEAGDKR